MIKKQLILGYTTFRKTFADALTKFHILVVFAL